jgi:hypothetical protein
MHSSFAFSHLQPYHPYGHAKKSLTAGATWRIPDRPIRYAYEERESVKCIFSLLVSILHNVNG